MSIDWNLFEGSRSNKRSNIKTKTLSQYAKNCDKITRWCDELKLISKGDYLCNCFCFKQIANDTNSKDNIIDGWYFSCGCLENVSITLDVFSSCILYKVFWVYEWKSYNLIDFRFFDLDSQKWKQNWYLSDILIHWKAWRLQVVSGWKFNIYDFITELVSYWQKHIDRYLVALEEYYITRFDFRIDFFHKNEIKHLEYNDVFLSDSRKDVDNLVVDKHSKKIYTGRTAWNRKNKYIYTRMYQKQVQALDSWHWELYYDYLSYNWKVWRLEFEFLSKFTTARYESWKWCSLSDEFINHTLSKQIFEYLGVSEKNWFFSKPKSKIDIPFEFYSLHRKKHFITTLKNWGVKLLDAWINPFIIINEGIKEKYPNYDRQVLETLFDEALWWESYNSIIERVEKSKITTKELYDRILENQKWVDI